MPIKFLIKCLIKFLTFCAFRIPKKINGFLMNQFMNINVSKNGPFVSSSLRLFVSSSLRLFVSSSLSLLVS